MTAYKFKKLIPLILLLSLSAEIGYSREPRKLNYILGGGGEPRGEKTIFDGDLKLFANFVNKSDWENTISFNGGHSKTEEIINTSMGKARNVGDFNEVNYNKMIDEMIQKLESGELTQGDQLMINIDTHGAKKGKDELTHSIALSRSTATNLRTLSGARTVNLDRMERLATLAADKGVKLAIIDVSCFSGNLLNIKNDKTCLISATGRDQYGYAGTMQVMFFNMKFTFSGKFVDQFKKGRNLEEMFLKARLAADYTPDYPMISTPEGAEVDEKIYKMISPYLNYNEKSTTDFSKQYSQNPEAFEEQVCRIDRNHNEIKKFLKAYEYVTDVADELSKNEFNELRKALDEYRDYQLKYEESLRNTFGVQKEIKDILNRDFPDVAGELLKNYNATDLMLIDFDSAIKTYQTLFDKEAPGYSKNLWKRVLDSHKRQKMAVDHLKTALSPEATARLEAYKTAYSKSDVTKGLANKIATETKKVYSTLYNQAKKPESNPCRDFVL